MSRHTPVHQLADWAARTPDQPALHAKVDGVWRHRTWARFWEDTRAAAKGLIALGHQVGECVAIVGENRPEWLILEMAIMASRGAPAPIYATNTPDQTGYIVSNAQAKIAICDGRAQYDKYRRAMADGTMHVDTIITMDDLGVDADDVRTFDALLALGNQRSDDELDSRLDALSPDETALLIYTSGTTGKPKGVMLEHGGLVEVASALLARAPRFGTGEIPYRGISYLPLCHGAEQLVTTMGLLTTGGQVYFCPDLKQIKDYLVDVRPTVFLGVPRVWEKFEAALSARFAEATGVKAGLLSWARRVELDAVREKARTGKEPSSLSRTLANRLALAKIREAVGFDQIHLAVTGSAPISLGTLEFFASLGVVVNEAYGMTETHGVCTLADRRLPRLGTVGRALDGVQIRIADDGEVQLKGRTMTRGYFGLPEETADLYTDDGWLCTGDIGELDAEGNLSITGRKKEIIITAGAKNVAPVELEHLMQQIPGVGQTVVVGDRQPYLCALVTIDIEAVDAMARRFGCASDLATLAENEAFRAYVEEQIATECNAKVARYQTIKKFRILPVEFSVEGDELTPTAKLRRDVIARKYAEQIAAFYDAVPARA